MPKIVLFDLPAYRIALEPFAFTRPLSHIRIGIATIAEKWKHYFPGDYSYLTCSTLHSKYATDISQDAWYINSTICPDIVLAETVKRLKFNEILLSEHEEPIAFRLDWKIDQESILETISKQSINRIIFSGEITQVKLKWDIFALNAREIMQDWSWYAKGAGNYSIDDPYTIAYNERNIFIEDGLSIKSAILNAEEGPIYIGNNVTIEEGAVLRGPLAIGDNSCIQAHAHLYGGTTIGPCSNIGGQVYNSVIFGYSNKMHQGFMGNSVVGEWCNIDAGTNWSNAQYNTDTIPIWGFSTEESYQATSLRSCGSFMGDYSQSGINVTLEAGTVIDVAVNLTTGKVWKRHIPSFMHRDTDDQLKTVSLEKNIARIKRVMQSKNKPLLKEDIDILCNIFNLTAIHRMKAMI